MNRLYLVAAAIGGSVILGARPTAAMAQATVECSSPGGRVHCPIPNLDTESVSLSRQHSQAACRRDETWGVDRNGVWVSNGCRATFAFAYRSFGGNWPSAGTTECSSDGSRRYCRVNGIDPESVTMDRKLSQAACLKGESWDADGGGIWVSRGCRAVFGYATRGSGVGNRPPSNASSGTVECSSDGRRRHCRVDNIDPESVMMDRKLSQAPCFKGQSWDADAYGVWVSEGCRAEFGYVTRGGGNRPPGDVSVPRLKAACVARAARDWGVTEANLDTGEPRQVRDWEWEVTVSSKRTGGVCRVDGSGRVIRFTTQ